MRIGRALLHLSKGRSRRHYLESPCPLRHFQGSDSCTLHRPPPRGHFHDNSTIGSAKHLRCFLKVLRTSRAQISRSPLICTSRLGPIVTSQVIPEQALELFAILHLTVSAVSRPNLKHAPRKGLGKVQITGVGQALVWMHFCNCVTSTGNCCSDEDNLTSRKRSPVARHLARSQFIMSMGIRRSSASFWKPGWRSGKTAGITARSGMRYPRPTSLVPALFITVKFMLRNTMFRTSCATSSHTSRRVRIRSITPFSCPSADSLVTFSHFVPMYS